MLSTRDANYGIGRAIAPDTFVIDQVERKGHPHCYCDAATLVGLLAGFDLLTLSQSDDVDPRSLLSMARLKMAKSHSPPFDAPQV